MLGDVTPVTLTQSEIRGPRAGEGQGKDADTVPALGFLRLFFFPLCKFILREAYSKVPPAAKNTNPRTTANTRPYNPNGRLNPV